jgi:hypothetical protein
MSAPPTWSDVINKFLEALQGILYQIGNFLSTNAEAIATAMIGIALAVGLYAAITRIPLIRSMFARIF